MVKIKKGNNIRFVPMSVYKNFYKQNGWIAKGEKVKESTNSDLEIEQEQEEEQEEEQIDFSSMSTSELKQFAQENQIDISEASSKKQIISILENAMSI